MKPARPTVSRESGTQYINVSARRDLVVVRVAGAGGIPIQARVHEAAFGGCEPRLRDRDGAGDGPIEADIQGVVTRLQASFELIPHARIHGQFWSKADVIVNVA